MARSPRDIAVGYYEPVMDKETNKQVIDSKKGKKWLIRVELPRRGISERPRRYKTVYGTERKVVNEMNQFVAKINQDLATSTIPHAIRVDASRMLFKECVENWLETNKDNNRIKRRTFESYVGYAHNHIIPYLGHIALCDMTAFHISLYRDLKLRDGQSLDGKKLHPGTVNKHLSLISNVLEDSACPEKMLIPMNPTRLVKRAKGGQNSANAMVNCLRVKDLNSLFEKLSLLYSYRNINNQTKNRSVVLKNLKQLGFTDEEIKSHKATHKFRVVQLYPVVYLGAITGMRLSELLALKWDDIDFDDRTIYVYQSSHYGIKEEGEESAHHLNCTKEGKPKSLIELSHQDIEFLNNYHTDQKKRRWQYESNYGKYMDYGLVFARNDGDYLRNDTVSTEFGRFARDNGFSVTFHGLRHTHCTLLVAANVPLAYVARRVGHQRTSTTNSYTHIEKTPGVNLGDVFHGILTGQQKVSEKQIRNAEKVTRSLRVVGDN